MITDKYLSVSEKSFIDQVVYEIELERNLVLIDEDAHQELFFYLQQEKEKAPIPSHYITEESVKDAINYLDEKDHILMQYDLYQEMIARMHDDGSYDDYQNVDSYYIDEDYARDL